VRQIARVFLIMDTPESFSVMNLSNEEYLLARTNPFLKLIDPLDGYDSQRGSWASWLRTLPAHERRRKWGAMIDLLKQ